MQSSFVKRPFRSQQKPATVGNIFASCEEIHLPVIKQLARNEDQDYHLVGPTHLRKQIMQEQNPPRRNDSLEHLEDRRSLPELSGTIQTTVLRESVLSKLGQHQRKALTRDKRNLQFYKDYQQYWENSSRRFRDATGGIHPTLLEGTVQRLLVIPNPQKEQLLKNYVNSFWEMSLRNNNYILKRHIKGENRYGEVEMEGMLLSGEGTKMVEQSIPKLPLEKLRKTDHRQFALTGRNKLAAESLSCDPSIASQYTSRLSKAMTDGAALDRNQQILKMSYDASHNFLKEEILT